MKQTIAFKMKLKPGMLEEYERRHAAIWPELISALKDAGIRDYHIFFDQETHILFAVQEVEAGGGSQSLGNLPVVQQWWAYMSDLMEVNEDRSPVSTPLKEVFLLP